MSLHDDVKVALRVTSDALDTEVDGLIAAALADMRRAGVDQRLLDEGAMYPLAKAAVVMYVKANFGYDNSEAGRFLRSYNQTLALLCNSAGATGEWSA